MACTGWFRRTSYLQLKGSVMVSLGSFPLLLGFLELLQLLSSLSVCHLQAALDLKV